MYIHGLIPRNFAELAEAVPIDLIILFRCYSRGKCGTFETFEKKNAQVEVIPWLCTDPALEQSDSDMELFCLLIQILKELMHVQVSVHVLRLN